MIATYARPGDRLRAWMRANGVTAADLARRTGVSRQYISAIINDRYGTLGTLMVRRLAESTGIDEQEWFRLEGRRLREQRKEGKAP